MAATISLCALDLESTKMPASSGQTIGADTHSQKFLRETISLRLLRCWGATKDENFYFGWPVASHRGWNHRALRANVHVFGIEEESDEEVFAKVIIRESQKKLSLQSLLMMLASVMGPKPLIVQSVRRDTKHQLMKPERKLKETNVYVKDDLTPLPAKITRDLRSNHDVRVVSSSNEKINVIMEDNQKLVCDNLYKLQKRDNELFSNAAMVWNIILFDSLGYLTRFLTL